jgi:hypothetical protein
MTKVNETTLPDWGDLVNLAETIAELTREKLLLEVKIKFEETEVVKKANTNEEYFQNGKPPSMSFVESTYKYSGFDGSLKKLREDLANATANLEKSKLKFDILRMQVEIYRTESANKRTVGAY